MVRKTFLLLGLSVVVGFVLLFLRGRTPKKAIPDLIELPARQERSEAPASGLVAATATITAAPLPTDDGPVRLLFDQPLSFAEVAYPELYAYDIGAGVYRVFNLVDRTYRDLYTNPNLINAWRSPSGRYLAIEQKSSGHSRFAVLDLNRDQLQPLDTSTQRLVWTDQDDLLLHLANQSRVNVIARWRAGQVTPLTATGFLSPRFVVVGERLFIAGGHDTPLISLDLTSNDRRVILAARRFIGLAARNSVALVATFDRRWQTALFDHLGQTIKNFDWGSLPEKCGLAPSFIICGVPKDVATLGSPEDWLEWRTNSIDDLILFDRISGTEQRLALGGHYDVLGPTLTPLGVVFTNRLDSRLYLIPREQFSFEHGPGENH